ncbi:TetR-like C-terminal domain-containing protein [Mycobacterium sp. NPDC003323]
MTARDSCEAAAPLERDRVLAGVLDELARWGIDRFDTAAMVDRHGWNLAAVTEVWPHPDQLILEALTTRPDDQPDAPDTGSLLDDLYVLATSMVALVSDEHSRKLHGAHLIEDPEIANINIRRAAWRARADRMRAIFDRASDRGELRSGVDYDVTLQLIFAPINMRILYTGEPVDDDFCRTLATMVCRAVAAV